MRAEKAFKGFSLALIMLILTGACLRTENSSPSTAMNDKLDKERDTLLGELLAKQPHFSAIETVLTIKENLNLETSYKIAMNDNIYRRDRGVVITYSKGSNRTLLLYPRSKKFMEEPNLKIWFINAQNPSVFISDKSNEVMLESVGTEKVNGYECIKVKAVEKKSPAFDKPKETVFFYIAQDLKNLVIKTEILTSRVTISYLLDNISIEAPDGVFSIPPDYEKINADPTAEYRLLDYFGLSEVKEFTPESVRDFLLGRIPIGSSEKAIYDFLNNCGIGKDKLSSVNPKDKNNEIVCRIEYDPTLPGLVKEHFGLFFLLDEERKLNDIRVKKWLTGL